MNESWHPSASLAVPSHDAGVVLPTRVVAISRGALLARIGPIDVGKPHAEATEYNLRAVDKIPR